ncbi:V-type ATP synthase subunit I [Patescibacteria group bacterium]|nr:V-type ATP synthase subunit I [Patescibacteria group bacterium]
MGQAKVAKINLVASKKFQQLIIQKLQDLSFVEIIDFDDKELEKQNVDDEMSKLDYQIAGIKFALDFLSNYDINKKSLYEKINPKIYITKKEVEKIISSFDHKKVVEDVQELESKINEVNNRIDIFKQELALISGWDQLDFIPSSKDFISGYTFKLVETNIGSYNNLIIELQKKLPLTEIRQVETNPKEVKAVIILKEIDEEKLTSLLNSLNVKTAELPQLECKVTERVSHLNKRLDELEKDLSELEKQAQKISKQQKNFKIYFDHLNWQRDRLINLSKTNQSWQTFSILAWIDEKLIDPLKEELNKITSNFEIEELPIKEDDAQPIIFKNTWAKPFESVTGIYGAPLSGEPDPTPFLAPFFTLFFGLALTDAGYGIMLSVFSLLAIKIMKVPKQSQKLFLVLFWGGVASFIIGVFTGGWFAIDLAVMPAFISAPLTALQIINPLENPLMIFYIALALGVVQVLFGLGVNTWWKIKNGQTKVGLMTSGLWILTIISLLVFAGSSMGLLSSVLAPTFKWITLSLVAALVIAKALLAKNFLVGLPLGVLGLYDFVGYFSDVLSYSRLLALGLTTGIIGMVVNIITGLVMGIPFVGWLIGALVFIGGHIFNLGINALGAFIHSGRLQYIEFFPKFMEGGGSSFSPFSKENKYIKITN